MSEVCGSQVGITILSNEIKIVNYPRRYRRVKIPHEQKKEVTTTKCKYKKILTMLMFILF